MTVPPERIRQIEARHAELSALMSAPDMPAERFVALSKEYAELTPVAGAASEVRRLREEQDGLAAMLADPEMKELAEAEAEELAEKLPAAETALQLLLLPRDAADDKPAMLEIRAGTGGDEAALFAGDLFRMYQKYAESRRWQVELISASSADVGGFKEVVASVTGVGVFARG